MMKHADIKTAMTGALAGKKRAKRPTTHWRILRSWMERELTPLAGQDGTAEMWESIEALDEHFDAIKRGAATKRQALKRGRSRDQEQV